MGPAADFDDFNAEALYSPDCAIAAMIYFIHYCAHFSSILLDQRLQCQRHFLATPSRRLYSIRRTIGVALLSP
jgi:hypothetical protein